MKRRLQTILLLFGIACPSLMAQYDPSFSHYWLMRPSYNPAAAGQLPQLNITGAFNMQMTGFTRAPQTMYAGVDMPLFFIGRKHGVGLLFLNDEIGLFSHKRFSLQYAFHQPLLGGTLSIGLQGDMLSESFDGSKVDVEDPNDPAFATSSVNGSKFDLSAGLYYKHKQWYVGLSMLHCLAPKVELGETYQFQIDPTYYLTAGYNIKMNNPFITIEPSVLMKYDGVNFRADITGRVEYNRNKRQLYGGASYSPSHSVTLFVGGMFHGVNLGYSYEAYTSGIGIQHGSHELVIGYQLDLNLYKKGKNKHKSVRLL